MRPASVVSMQASVKTFVVIALALIASSSSAQKVTKKDGKAAQPVHVFGQNLVTLPSSSPLYQIQIMVRTGSADDPAGKEGTANMVANALIEGGFGNAGNPVTKEKLAEITRPWGDAALPKVLVDKETTTFTVTVPRNAYPEFVNSVLKPMFLQPLWLQAELDRLRREALADIQSRLRFEDEESLGLAALDNWVFAGSKYDHLTGGTVKGLGAITREDLANFYKTYYQRSNISVATSINDQNELSTLMNALPSGDFVRTRNAMRARIEPGRQVMIITQPNAIATGLNLGFPIDVTCASDDYWPLFVGNVYLGTHRDDFGRLYHDLRADRGYNYGDYSYIEYMVGRPFFLFPPPTTPRSQQYFSIWIRPVAHQYTHFLLKAMTAELDQFVKQGLTAEQVGEAKIKARALYLNYAESLSRQLGYRLDDMFYGMKDSGYLQSMLSKIDAVTPEQVNAAIKKNLQSENLKYVIVTNESLADKLADDVAAGNNVNPKTLAEYHISEPVADDKKAMLQQDEQWKAFPMNIPRAKIQVIKAADMFESGPAVSDGAQ
jgi:zinc protease